VIAFLAVVVAINGYVVGARSRRRGQDGRGSRKRETYRLAPWPLPATPRPGPLGADTERRWTRLMRALGEIAALLTGVGIGVVILALVVLFVIGH